MWLEYGVEKIFEDLGYKTACGVYILGASGVYHEVDLLAEHVGQYKRVVVECKNTEISLDDVFKLFGKMSDLGCVYGYIFSTSIGKDRDVKKLAISKNIAIIEGVLEKDKESLKKVLSK